MKSDLFFFILIVFALGCGESTAFLPRTKFQGEMPLKPEDPTKLFGEDFSVRNTTYESQDKKYFVKYMKNKGFTTILDKLEGDTLFQGYCYHDRGIWYFKYPLSDTTFWLSAIQEKDNRLNGWPITFGQMYLVDTLVKSNQVTLDTLTTHFLLRPTKKNLRVIYGNLFSKDRKSNYELITQKKRQYDPNRRAWQGGKKTISNITLNMEEGYIDLDFFHEGDYTIDLFEKNGPLVFQEKIESKKFVHLDISDLNEGFHIMEVNDTKTGKLLVKSEIYIDN